jgi:hypothetical protein
MSFRISSAVLALMVLAGFKQVNSQSKSSTYNGFALVDKAGNIRKPADYRDHFETLGSWTVIDPKGDQIHFVYASPGAAEYYRSNGQFADGTMLVKEIWGTDHAQMTTGDAHWMSTLVQWFVLVKDAKGRFPGNPLWGNGWGWALFKADAPDKQVATDFKKDCLGCHVPAKATDWIYVKGYPVLRSAK